MRSGYKNLKFFNNRNTPFKTLNPGPGTLNPNIYLFSPEYLLYLNNDTNQNHAL